ncbi:hypothetical protein CUC15_04275 [Oceanobacillus zhaokaii]|uniref:Uncharacterized protein n=1 Tax=Oceanobacillus zhaokaii TaxID=2052660 RepID=A0A345PDZ7_9BACI|nr:hypothetical protein [Oceanobacillus zhaokaii]AXI08227.1 hypothetical protein CUC15_04275 [Oceanobacillus zhaokaii]
MSYKPIYNPDFHILNIDNKKVLKKQIVDRSLYENPKQGSFLFEIWKKVIDGYYNPEIVNSIFQYPDWIKCPDFYDIYYFCLIWAEIIDRDICFLKIDINEEPSADKEIEDNNRKLRLGLNQFQNTFTDQHSRNYHEGLYSVNFKPERGRGAVSDGDFSWTKPLLIDGNEKKKISTSKKSIFKLEPRNIPLEVGYTDSFTTYQHLRDSGGVARWAYNAKSLIIFIHLKHEGFDKEEILLDPDYLREIK